GASSHGRADDDDVLHYGRRRVDANLTRLEINRLAVAVRHAHLEIDDTVGAERADHRAGLRVELDESIPGRHINDAIVASPVGPVRHAATRELSRRHHGALALAQAVRPEHLTGLSIEGD